MVETYFTRSGPATDKPRRWSVYGPGVGYQGGLGRKATQGMTEAEAKGMAAALTKAYEAGRQSMQRDLRDLLGIVDQPS